MNTSTVVNLPVTAFAQRKPQPVATMNLLEVTNVFQLHQEAKGAISRYLQGADKQGGRHTYSSLARKCGRTATTISKIHHAETKDARMSTLIAILVNTGVRLYVERGA